MVKRNGEIFETRFPQFFLASISHLYLLLYFKKSGFPALLVSPILMKDGYKKSKKIKIEEN